MDAVKFIKERNRLCKTYNKCGDCPLFCGAGCNVISQIDPEVVVPIVEQWAKEHPTKTRQSEFLRQWPEARTDRDEILLVCPAELVQDKRLEHGGCRMLMNDCNKCRREFWMQEVE